MIPDDLVGRAVAPVAGGLPSAPRVSMMRAHGHADLIMADAAAPPGPADQVERGAAPGDFLDNDLQPGPIDQ